MRRWIKRLAISLVVILVSAVVLVPWYAYAIGLSKVDGRPSHASFTKVTHDDMLMLRYQRLISSTTPTHDVLSPHRYILMILWGNRNSTPDTAHLALHIAIAYNQKHLEDRHLWHLSCAALTIWLARNWTKDDLIAKAVELQKDWAALKNSINR